MRLESNINMISVVIPMYNSEKTIERALNSILYQSYTGIIEVIVVNDGSMDNSQKVVEDFIQLYPEKNIKLINQKNGGVSKARNTGLKNAMGNYIALLDSDDEWLSEKLIKQIPYLDKFDFVTCLRNNDKLSFPYKTNTQGYSKVTLRNLLFKVVGQTSTAIFKREILEDIGFFDENQKFSEDANYWMKISNSKNMIILNEKLVITGGGKPSVGFSGLSANIKAMEDGVQKNIKEMYRLNYINFFEFLFFKSFAKIKYILRKIKYS